VQGNVVHEFPHYQLPFKPPGILLKKPVIQHQKGGVVLPVYTREEGEKIPWQNRKNTGWHFSTVGKEVLFVKVDKQE
jgi:hypothetical protein